MGFLGSINWDSESFPLPKDFIFLPFFALFFFAIRLFLDSYVFENLGIRLIFGKGYGKVDVGRHAERKKIIKFKESAWKCVYFLSAEILALSVTYNEPWFTNTKYFWQGPGDQVWPDQKMKLKLKGLYMYASGFYTYSIVALVFWETRRSDFGVSMAHHIISVVLLLQSYIFRFARAGSIVLALHDATDVFMEFAKMSKYGGYEWLASVFFSLFVLMFTLLRIICYPFWILRSTSYEVLLTLDKVKYRVEGPLHYYFFNSLLVSLFVINFYWWILMIRMVVLQIKARGVVSDDVRSDSEGDDEHDD